MTSVPSPVSPRSRSLSCDDVAGRALAEGGEKALIAWLTNQTAGSSDVTVGIGDDAAVLDWSARDDLLVAVDTLVEGVHFDLASATPELVGRKALAVNLSDIAAMAGRPLAAFVAVTLPRDADDNLAQKLHQGLIQLAEDFDVAIAGGDTTSGTGPLVISVTIIGESLSAGPVLRSGASPGDRLVVTGPLGYSLADHHLSFTPRLVESRILAECGGLHAMIDLSDGLSTDLDHLLSASGVAAVVEARSLPIREIAGAPHDGRTPLAHAISDGEDFELLAAVAPDALAKLLQDDSTGISLFDIGEVTTGEGACLLMPDGRRVPMVASGYEHDVPGSRPSSPPA